MQNANRWKGDKRRHAAAIDPAALPSSACPPPVACLLAALLPQQLHMAHNMCTGNWLHQACHKNMLPACPELSGAGKSCTQKPACEEGPRSLLQSREQHICPAHYASTLPIASSLATASSDRHEQWLGRAAQKALCTRLHQHVPCLDCHPFFSPSSPAPYP